MLFQKKLLILLLLLSSTFSLSAKDHNQGYTSYYIVAIAKSKLGKEYVWGGNGPYSYDCSGFTKEVFAKLDIKIPRNSWNQAKVGKKISKKNLRRGDLVFFHSKHHTKVDHVGIYLGHGKFIHASKFHKHIVISPLREYRRYFKWGRRLG